jgi:hypothetical protein
VRFRSCAVFEYYYFGHPRGDLNDLSSSSYGLSLFSWKAGSHPGEGAGAAPDGSSSMGVGELWPGIDQLDDVGHENALVALAQDWEGNRSPHSYAGSHEVVSRK